MDEQPIDTLARTLAARGTRRRALLGALGVGAAGVAAAFRARTGVGAGTQPLCAEEGDPCTIWGGCCDALTCVGSATNPNNGVCIAGVATQALDPTRAPSTRVPRSTGRDTGSRGATATSTPTFKSRGGTVTATPKPDRKATRTAARKEDAVPSPTPRPTREPKDPIAINLECGDSATSVEKTMIRNTSERRIRVNFLKPLVKTLNGLEQLDIGQTLQPAGKPGDRILYVTGGIDPEADFDYTDVIYGESRREGVRVDTDAGAFRAYCLDQVDQ